MNSALKYRQSFGKCSEQDMTFSHTFSQRAALLVQDGSKERKYPSTAFVNRPRYRAVPFR